MANRIVSVHAGICGIGMYAIMLPSSGFSVAHYRDTFSIPYASTSYSLDTATVTQWLERPLIYNCGWCNR